MDYSRSCVRSIVQNFCWILIEQSTYTAIGKSNQIIQSRTAAVKKLWQFFFSFLFVRRHSDVTDVRQNGGSSGVSLFDDFGYQSNIWMNVRWTCVVAWVPK